MKLTLLTTLLVSLATACSAGAPTSQTSTPTEDAGSDPSTANDSGSKTTVSSADVCNFLLAKNCPGVENTPSHLSTCTQAFDLGAQRGCSSYIEKGWTCLKGKNQSALTCQLNDVYVTDPQCAESGTAMTKCAAAMSDPKCYAGSCQSFTDCPTGYSCNEKIGQCFDNAHSCLGAPCDSFTDCSTGLTCNQALKLCTKK